MKKFVLSLVTSLLLCATALSDVKIGKENHVQNWAPGRCAWCALETLGRTHGWGKIRGLAERNARVATHGDEIAELDRYVARGWIRYEAHWPQKGENFYYLMHQKFNEPNVEYVWSLNRSKRAAESALKGEKTPGRWWIVAKPHWDTADLRAALDDDLGASVSLRQPPTPNDMNPNRHVVVITHMGERVVRLTDSNYPPGTVRIMPTYLFLEQWDGFFITILKK